MNWLVAACLMLAVSELHLLQIGARANEISCRDDRRERQKTSPNDPFPCRSITIPVKVHCDDAKAVRKYEPGAEETRIVSEVREKQKMRRSAVPAAAEKRTEEGTAVANVARVKSRASAMAAECEQCEIQIKANGDGIFLRCRKCHPTDADGLRFPNASPNRVVQLP